MAARDEGFCAFASVPLRSNFNTYGTLNVHSRDEREISEEEVQLLTSMAAQIALAVGTRGSTSTCRRRSAVSAGSSRTPKTRSTTPTRTAASPT